MMGKARRNLVFLSLTVAATPLVWSAMALTELVPSLVDVFGIDGLRLPFSASVGGLMLAAVVSNQWCTPSGDGTVESQISRQGG